IPYDRLGGLAERVTGVVVVVGLAVALAVVTWLLGVAGTILAHAGFTITQQGDHLLIERGLLERRRATIPIERIQAIRIIEGVVRQPFGLVELRVESAGYGPKAGESTVLCPLLRSKDVQPFLEQMAPSMAVEGTFETLPTRARRRYMFQLPILVQPLLLIVPLIYFFYPLGLLSLLLLPGLVVLGYWQYRDAGWAVVGDTLLLRWRSVSRTTAIVPRRRVQVGETHANLFQRRVGLSTLSFRVPSGTGGASFGLMHMDHETALRLLAWFVPRR
ncbi:MAG TPA: PH domain-containing protein, partial [Thermomicrobiales bacterium]|nr:PH domain-containing protein [Thermomicrobiales bacterium]